MTSQRKQRLRRQLQESRYRLRKRDAAFAAPLTEMLFVATKDVWRISTNGSCIYFDPDWLQKLGHTELDFIIAHQLMHIALGHIDRATYYKGDRFHLACDIVANSYLELLHWEYDRLPHIGRIFRQTFFFSAPGRDLTEEDALHAIPFDPAALHAGARRQYMIDSETRWDQKNDRGECGEIVLSPADIDPDDLTDIDDLYESAVLYLIKKRFLPPQNGSTGSDGTDADNGQRSNTWDASVSEELTVLRNTVQSQRDIGQKEDFIERIQQRAQASRLPWRKLLDSFIQDDVCDYSFTPPDKRFQDSSFFLPDYHVHSETPKHVLFMVDTSGSVDDTALEIVFAEICNSLTQFEGGLVGTLACFDVRVYTPVPFEDIDDLLRIKPRGGGGTDFRCAFDYIRTYTSTHPPSSIVIFTDGHGEFPPEDAADNIPVLWLLSDPDITVPWGRYAYVDPIQYNNTVD